MSIVSMRSKKRFLEYAVSAFVCFLAFLMQMMFLNYMGINGAKCNLPLTLTIVWGLVFGSRLPAPSTLELRRRSFREIFTAQLASGSTGGFLIGWLFSWIYFSIFPGFYPFSFPLIGWVSGYFCLRGLGQGNLICVPMTFILTIVAEAFTSWELLSGHYASSILAGAHFESYDPVLVFERLRSFILPEALLNSIIAPFIYFPMRNWHDLVEGQRSSLLVD